MSSDGVYLRNETPNNIAFTAPDREFQVTFRPNGVVGDVQYIPEAYADSHGIRRLIDKGLVTVVTGDEAAQREKEQYQAAEDERQERRSQSLENIDDINSEDLYRVRCSAVTTKGNQCSRWVTVKASELDEGGNPLKPVYCRQHAPYVD